VSATILLRLLLVPCLLITGAPSLPGQDPGGREGDERAVSSPAEDGESPGDAEVGSDDPPPRPRRGRRRRPEPPAATPTPPPPEEESSSEEEEDWLAVIGGTIHTVSGGVVERGTILVRNGRIHEVGVELPVPPGARRLEVEGHHVYPGLVAVNSVGIVGGEFDTDPYSFTMLLALAGGVTTARSGGSISKLTYGTLDGLEVGSSPFVTLNYSTGDPAGRRKLREAFERIREFRRESARHAEAKEEDPKLPDLDRKWIKGLYATAEQLMDGKRVGYARVRELAEIRAICGLAEKYGFDLVLDGAEEGWIEPGVIARAGARVIVTPRARRDRDDRRLAPNGSSIQNAAILHRHGVRFAIFPVGSLFAPGGGVSLSGLAGRDLLHLAMEAAFAVRGGLSDEEAIRAITLGAAELLRIDERVGSIEVGKDADLVITDGPLLHYLSLPQYTIVNGRVAYDQDEAGVLDHVRRDGRPEPEVIREPWPRRLGDPF